MRRSLLLLLGLWAMPAFAAPVPPFSLTELKGATWAQESKASSAAWRGHPRLVAFWRADCAPCLRELPLLAAIAVAHPDLAVSLVGLQSADAARSRRIALPRNVQVLVLDADPRAVLVAFGNDRTIALPYSVMLDSAGRVCARRYGMLSPDIVSSWRRLCA